MTRWLRSSQECSLTMASLGAGVLASMVGKGYLSQHPDYHRS
jgi:hypothetical protein